MKPEAGQWWQMKDDAETRCFIVGECRNGNYIIEWKDGEYSEDNMEDWEHIPDCDDFNWKEPETVNDELKEQVAAFIGNYYGDQCDEYEQDCIICSKWKAFRELFELPEPQKPKPEPQPAEDPDEWVIQDRVPVRVGDRCYWVGSEPLPKCWSKMWQAHPHALVVSRKNRHGDKTDDGKETLHVMCRRRDLPKVEQAEQWPKYWTTFDPDGFAFVKQITADECQCILKDGTHGPVVSFNHDHALDRKQLTEAEAMALLKKPQPQPQKTRVRLWATPEGRPYFAPFQASKRDDEIRVDSEGFYVEGCQS